MLPWVSKPWRPPTFYSNEVGLISRTRWTESRGESVADRRRYLGCPPRRPGRALRQLPPRKSTTCCASCANGERSVGILRLKPDAYEHPHFRRRVVYFDAQYRILLLQFTSNLPCGRDAFELILEDTVDDNRKSIGRNHVSPLNCFQSLCSEATRRSFERFFVILSRPILPRVEPMLKTIDRVC